MPYMYTIKYSSCVVMYNNEVKEQFCDMCMQRNHWRRQGLASEIQRADYSPKI